MNNFFLNNVGILFTNKNIDNINNIKINLTNKDFFYNNKLILLNKEKKELNEYNNILKIEYKFIFNNWKLEHSCNKELIENILIEIKRLNNLIKYNNNKICIINSRIKLININKYKNDL